MNTIETLKELIEVFERTNNKYNLLNKKANDYCTGVNFPPSEINTLVMIKKYKMNNITELARQLGVSKSAVSQIIFRLEKKGVITKYKDIDNSKNIIVKLTELGITAVDSYEKYRSDIYGTLIKTLDKMNNDQVTTIKNFFYDLEKFIDQFI